MNDMVMDDMNDMVMDDMMSMDDMKMDNMSMDDMQMVMTFTGWNEYQLKIIFDSWDVTKKWQFILSIIAVICASAANRRIKYFNNKIITNKIILYSLLSAGNYGLSLMLMLVAMTYNPSLFLALVVGYGIGEYFCINIENNKNNENIENNLLKDCECM